MRILLTGAFGNIGLHTAEALLARGFHVTTFDLATPRARKLAGRLTPAERLRLEWGDLRDPEQVRRAVHAAAPEAIVHLAAIIPPPAYFDAALARSVNVDGFNHLLTAAAALPRAPRVVFASSYTIHGSRNGARALPLLSAATPVAPVDAYAGHKVEGELMLRRSGLPWVTLRLGACLPLAPGNPDPRVLRMAFEIPRETRSHGVDQRDAATAFANAVDADALSRVLMIGGNDSFRVRARQFSRRYQHALGLTPFADHVYAAPDPEVEALVYEHLGRVLPDARAGTVVRLSATARTAERFTRNHRGAMLGWEMSPDQWATDGPARRPPSRACAWSALDAPRGGITPVMVSAMQVAARIQAGGAPSG